MVILTNAFLQHRFSRIEKRKYTKNTRMQINMGIQMIPKFVLVDAISKALRDAQADTVIKLDDTQAILLIDQSILENDEGQLCKTCH